MIDEALSDRVWDMRPAEADFGVTVSFERGKADPVRVFEALTLILHGFSELDRVMVGALDAKLAPLMVLEDVEAQSITAWARTKLRQTDDEVLKSGDWKKALGAALTTAKYRVLEYLDAKVAANEGRRLEQLRSDLEKIAHEPELRHMPLPAEIKLKALVVSLDRIQEGKALLTQSEKLTIRSEGEVHEVDISETKRPSDYLSEVEGSKASGTMAMTMLVRRPDYLGNTKWEFKHGPDTISAAISDEEWLNRFRSGLELVLPGSALECLVAYHYSYGKSGDLLNARHEIIRVLRVIVSPESPTPTFAI
jgi:hypothetical protein